MTRAKTKHAKRSKRRKQALKEQLRPTPRKRRKPTPVNPQENPSENPRENPLQPVSEQAKERVRRKPTTEDKSSEGQKASKTEGLESEWDSEPRQCYFSGRPGPGMPRRSKAGRKGEEREGDGGEGEIDLLAAFYDALRAFGPKEFCRKLLKTSPVSAAQLLANLRKNEPGDQTGQVNVILPAGSPLASILDPERPEVETDASAQEPALEIEASDGDDWIDDLQDAWECSVCPAKTKNAVTDLVCRTCGMDKEGKVPREPDQPAVRDHSNWVQHSSIEGALHPDDEQEEMWVQP